MKQETIKYQDMLDLGGVRGELNGCPVYIKERGHHYFWVDLKLTKRFSAYWCCETRTVEIQKESKSGGSILSSFKVRDLEQLKELINLFKGITPKGDEPSNKSVESYPRAC